MRGLRLRLQGLWGMKGKTMPTQRGSNMSVGQKETPGSTTKDKSTTLWNNLLHRGAMSLGT
eukprot:scaffold107800_cov23-Cyclotella_meneghiniana.AAC.1